MAIKLEGEGVKALMPWQIVEELFCGFPYLFKSGSIITPEAHLVIVVGISAVLSSDK